MMPKGVALQPMVHKAMAGSPLKIKAQLLNLVYLQAIKNR